LLTYILAVQVAASGGKETIAKSSFSKAAASAPVRDSREEDKPVQEGQRELKTGSEQPIAISNNGSGTAPGVLETPIGHTSKPERLTPVIRGSNVGEASLVDAVKSLDINEPMPSLVVNGSGTADSSSKSDLAEVFPEDPFLRTDSGSELGTKPPSLDGKSITSGTTFALDEKESLRPDDSASVKAAEDDDAFSGRGSIVAGSRIGSEAAARAYRSQFYEAPDKRGMPPSMQERQSQGVSTPPSGSSEQQIVDDLKPKPLVGAAGVPDTFNLFYRQTPDEKLLEALESPKDRIFLLRLEQDVIEFVKDSK
jgi:hypothetical protein